MGISLQGQPSFQRLTVGRSVIFTFPCLCFPLSLTDFHCYHCSYFLPELKKLQLSQEDCFSSLCGGWICFIYTECKLRYLKATVSVANILFYPLSWDWQADISSPWQCLEPRNLWVVYFSELFGCLPVWALYPHLFCSLSTGLCPNVSVSHTWGLQTAGPCLSYELLGKCCLRVYYVVTFC